MTQRTLRSQRLNSAGRHPPMATCKFETPAAQCLPYSRLTSGEVPLSLQTTEQFSSTFTRRKRPLRTTSLHRNGRPVPRSSRHGQEQLSAGHRPLEDWGKPIGDTPAATGSQPPSSADKTDRIIRRRNVGTVHSRFTEGRKRRAVNQAHWLPCEARLQTGPRGRAAAG